MSRTATVAATGTVTRLCTFRVADLWLGVDVLSVQEVLRNQPLTGVPRAPRVVEGLLNLRGEIVVALEVRRRLQLPEREDHDAHVVVVLRNDQDERVSLLVDEVGDVLDVEELPLETVPDTVVGVAREVVQGAYQLPGKLLLLVDTEKISAVTP